MKGSRVQAVVQELRGEKIDIVPYDRDPARFVCAAIQPAEVNKVIVDEADGRMELVVPDEKLSLAIGRKGQNVRLAAQLTGWKLDIISEQQVQADGGGGDQPPSSRSRGSSETIARSMYRLGFRALEELAEASEQELGGHRRASAAPRRRSRSRTSAETTMERLRQERIQAASSTHRAADRAGQAALRPRRSASGPSSSSSEAGYRTVEDIHREDEDKLAIKTGLGIKKARAIKQGAEHFLASESKTIEAQRRVAAKAAKERESESTQAEEGAAST